MLTLYSLARGGGEALVSRIEGPLPAEFLTTEEAIVALGIARPTLYAWLESGALSGGKYLTWIGKRKGWGVFVEPESLARERARLELLRVREESGVSLKGCTHCFIRKPLEEFRRKKGHRLGICRDCERAQKRAHYAQDPEPHRAHSRKYAQTPGGKQRRRAYIKVWRAENAEHVRQWQQSDERRARSRFFANRYRANQPMAVRQAYYQRVRVEARERGRRWRENNRNRYNEKAARRRAMKENAPQVERIDRDAIILRDASTCYLCGRLLGAREIHLDHVVALANQGPHTADNLRVSCQPCNSRKKDLGLEEFREKFGYGPVLTEVAAPP